MKVKCLFFVLGLFTFVQAANADLVLSINTADETLRILESDTGTLDGDGGYSWGSFAAGDVLPLTGSGLPGGNLVLEPGFVEVFGTDFSNPGATVTLTGSGTAISYASLSSSSKLELESRIGTSLAPGFGAGFSPLRIVSAVPEPGSVTLITLGIVAIGLRRRRKRTF